MASREQKRKRRAVLRAVLINAKDVPCADCGLRYPSCVMEFDHVRGTKCFDLSDASNRCHSWQSLRDEMLKCDVVCANCHRIRTHNGKHHLRKHADPILDHPELF